MNRTRTSAATRLVVSLGWRIAPGFAGVWTTLLMLGGSTAILIAAEQSTVRLSGLLLAVRVNRELAAPYREHTPEPSDKDRQPKDAHVDERQQRAAHLGGLPVDECERRIGEDIGDTVPVEQSSGVRIGRDYAPLELSLIHF